MKVSTHGLLDTFTFEDAQIHNFKTFFCFNSPVCIYFYHPRKSIDEHKERMRETEHFEVNIANRERSTRLQFNVWGQNMLQNHFTPTVIFQY